MNSERTVVALSLLALLALTNGGCSTLTEVHGGPVIAIAKKGEPQGGVSVDANAGLGFTRSATDTYGLDVVARLKVTPDSQHAGFGEGFFVASRYGNAVAIMRGGVHLLFERFQDDLLVGGGVYGSAGVGLILNTREYFSPGIVFDENRRQRTILTLGPAIELDTRFAQSGTLTFFGFNIGIAWADEHVGPRENGPTTPPGPAPGPL